MPLSKDFVFSANALQAYLNCQRLFELKYILKQKWPAIASTPVQMMEARIQQGNLFHQFAHQYLSGIPANDLEAFIDDPDIKAWFGRYIGYIQPYLDSPFLSELSLVMPIEGFRVIAIFDFIACIDHQAILIADWKTTTRQPKRETYLQSIQSLLYPLMAYTNQQRIFPNLSLITHHDISMAYWFPAFPGETITLQYSKESHKNNLKLLSSLIAEIAEKETGTFEKTLETGRCNFCQFRSLCDRGIQAGNAENMADENSDSFQIDALDFDQIDEIAF